MAPRFRGDDVGECHCEEPTGPAFGGPDDKLRDEAIHTCLAARWIASRSLSSGAHSRDPLARNDGKVSRLSFRGTRSVNPESRDSGSGPLDHPGMTVLAL